MEQNLMIFVLASIIGYLIISKIPQRLHTPLMSATNAISGITLIGCFILMVSSNDYNSIILLSAIFFASVNVVGGYFITAKMLQMFKSKR